MSDDTLKKPDGQERLYRLLYWMHSQDPNITYCSIAANMGISAQSVSAMLRKPVISPVRHKQLINAGLPPELLPEPGVVMRGRKPQSLLN